MENRIPLRTYFDSLLQRVELQIQDYEDNAGDPLTLCRQFVQDDIVRGGYAKQDNDCLVVLICRQCRGFRQAS